MGKKHLKPKGKGICHLYSATSRIPQLHWC